MHTPPGSHAVEAQAARAPSRRLSRPATSTVVAAALVGVFSVIALWNAFSYPPVGGYDAAEHIAYARSLVEQGEIPHRTGTYYTPPLWYALAGSAMQLGEGVGMEQPERLGQALNGILVAITAVLVFVLARMLFPGRPLLALGTLAFFVACPLTLRMATMFHPQALVLLLSTAGLLLVARMVARRRYGLATAAAAGILVGAAELVRSVGIWSYGVAVLVLLAAVLLDRERRRKAAAALAVVVALGLLVPLPWYAYLQHTYGYAVFGRPATQDVPAQPEPVPLPVPQPPSAPVAPAPAPPPPAPIWFYVGSGLPDVITHPQRDRLPRDFFPIVYADTWGDVFGSWAWGATRAELADAEDRLVVQSLAGIPLTFLGVAGLIAAAVLAVRRPRRLELLVVVGMPAAALAGMLYYGARSYEAEVDFVKGMFALPAIPFWALGFGLSLDAIWHRAPRPVGVAVAGIVAAALAVCLEFGIA